MLSIWLLQSDCRLCNTCCHEHRRGELVIRRRDLRPRRRQMEIHRLHRFRAHGPNIIRLYRPRNRRPEPTIASAQWRTISGNTTSACTWGISEEERRIVLRNCEIGTTRELKMQRHRTTANRADHPLLPSPLWSYEITDTGTNIFGPLPDWEHDVLNSVDFPTLRKQGPTPDTLKWASRVYSVAQLNKGPATNV